MNKLIVILGPTATGKTKLAVKLASVFGGEIISIDSRQIYREMDIGTGKDIEEYKKIKYHLIDIITPDKPSSLAEFQELCYQKMNKIWKRKKIPLLVGGTGLYIESILNKYQIPAAKPDLKLRKKLEKQEIPELLKNLKKLSIKKYNIVDKKNKRRIIRAIEIFSKKRGKKIITKLDYEYLILGIDKNKEELNKIINERVDKMIKEGLVEEVKKIIKKYGKKSAPLQTIGYKEIIDHLDKKTSLIQAQELTKLHTRQFAKRQLTWFRGMEKRNNQNKINWVGNYGQTRKLVKEFLG